jgi:hypothetical protein
MGDTATQRDYTKFLKPDGQLNVRVIPRPVYLEMLEQLKSDPEHIEAVFGELYWLWDLNDRARKADAAGRQATRVELAREIIGEMDDQDWWKLTETFETRLWTTFAAEWSRYATLLDPVYDLQEREGWRELHHEKVELPS